jgi:hypothetical protein
MFKRYLEAVGYWGSDKGLKHILIIKKKISAQ